MRDRRIIALVATAALLVACGTGTGIRTEPPAGPASPDTAPAAPVMGMSPLWRPVTVCVADSAGMREMSTTYNMRTGDTLVDGRPFAELYPMTAEHAATQRWYVDNELISFGGRRYVKLGTRVWLRPGSVRRIGTYRGVPVFREATDAAGPPDGIYVLVLPSCEFHFYDLDLSVSGVRG